MPKRTQNHGSAPPASPRFLTLRDIAAELQISRSQAHRVVTSEILHHKSGRVLRVPRAAFETYLRRKEHDPCLTGSSSAGRFGTAGSTARIVSASSAAPDAAIGRPPKLRLASSNDVPPIRLTRPRTKPR